MRTSEKIGREGNAPKFVSAQQSGCGDVLILNVSKMRKRGIWEPWLETNAHLLCPEYVAVKSSTCSHEYRAVTLSSFTDIELQAEWLRANNEWFCFSESYYFIERAHRVNQASTNLDEVIEEQMAVEKFSFSLEEIVLKGIEFDSLFYEEYITLEILLDDNQNRYLEIKPDYLDTAKVCYSVPFFKSILEKYKIVEFWNCIFDFVEITIPDQNPPRTTIAFRMSYDGDTIINYYDYSTQPGKPFTIVRSVV